MKTILYTLLFSCFAVTASATDKEDIPRNVRQAELNFVEFDFFEALDGFQEGLHKHPDHPFILRRIADCFRHMGLLEDAKETYTKLISSGGYDHFDFYHLSEVHRALGEHESSQFWMSEYARRAPNDSRPQRLLQSPDYHIDLSADGGQYNTDALGVNHKRAVLPPNVGEELFFIPIATEVEGPWYPHRRHIIKYDLYQTAVDDSYNLVSAEPVPGQVNSKFSEGPACYDSKREQLLVTRFFTKKGRPAIDEEGHVFAMILCYEMKEGAWIETDLFPFNDDLTSCAYPSLSKDGNTLYFAANGMNSVGGMDLFYAEWDEEEGEWGAAVNMGPEINTEGNEIYPAIAPDGRFTFSSDGHPGLGGLDLFFADFNQPSKAVTNPGMPMNTPDDDFGLRFIGDEYGYFCSDRDSETGGDDLFWWEAMREVIEATFVLMDGKGLPMYPEKVEIRNLRSNQSTITSGLRGEFTAALNGRDPYEFTWEHNGEKMVMHCHAEQHPEGTRYAYTSPQLDHFVADAKVMSYKESAFRKRKIPRGQWSSFNLTDNPAYPSKDLDTDNAQYLLAQWSDNGLGEHPVDGSKAFIKNMETGAMSSSLVLGSRAEFEVNADQVHALIWYDHLLQKRVSYLQPVNEGNDMAFASEVNCLVSLSDDSQFSGNASDEMLVLAALTASTDEGILLEHVAGPFMKLLEEGREVRNEDGLTKVHARELFFGFDQARLSAGELAKLNDLKDLMESSQHVRIEVLAHTDARGSMAYNKRLARYRADAAKAALVALGIDADRISTIAVGEDQPVNHCIDGVPCSRQEHRLNRRAEILVVLDGQKLTP